MEPSAGLSLEGLRVKQPAENLTLSSEEGERLIAQVHQSNLPAAVAGRLEQIIRTCLWLVFALQETKITVKRLRSLLFGKSFKALPAPEDASESSQTSGDETRANGVLEPDARGSAMTACEAPLEPSQSPERVKAQRRPSCGDGASGCRCVRGCRAGRVPP